MDSGRHYYSHEHALLHHYVENGSTEEHCDVCDGEIYGMVYACHVCKFTRHASCAGKGMPSQITHPSHSMHDLELIDWWSSDFLCERCFYNSRGPFYRCSVCEIAVDLACASSTIDQPTQGDQGLNLIPAGRVRNRTSHFSHEDPLDLFKYRKTSQQFELDCSWCHKRLSGMSYGCVKYYLCGRKFFLHESCISKIPNRLLHPFHPLHYLYVQYGQSGQSFSCNACKRSISDKNVQTYYACHDCRFYLHISCAGLQPTLKHKCHQHYLTYFSRSTKEYCFDCHACGLDCNARNNKEGAFYRCVQCDFNIHLRCLPAPPIAKHGYHLHFLVLHRGVIEDDSEEYYCDICEEERHPKDHIYYCKKCKFIAHLKCVLGKISEAKVRKMMRLVKRVRQSNGEFPKLKETEDKNQLLKMQEIHSLLKDLEQEKKEKQKYFEKDEYAERYASGDDDDVDEVDEKEEEESSDGEQENESENEEKEEKNEANQEEASTSINDTKELNRHPLEPSKNSALEIRHFSHDHPLKIVQLTGSSKYGNCNACAEELRDTIYICQLCKDHFREDYRLHKACTELPYELQHPLHSQHSLILLSRFPHSESRWFLCDECGDFSAGFVYLCMDCPFQLDVKCAVFAAPKIGSQDPKHRKTETKLLHFSHEHALVLGNLVHMSKSCIGCNLPISGPAYCCLDCFYAIHESCFRILPQEMHHPFHPLHPLVAFSYNYGRKCHACKLSFTSYDFYSIQYGCLQCDLYLHFVCANSLKRVLKSNSHEHNLYYFGPDSQVFLDPREGPNWCSRCSKFCKGPFYRCVECTINFDLKCVVPQKIKSKSHLHHLTLKDSFIEDDIGVYYCDVCEEERHPKDHIYYCEECHGFFVAHIECMLSMDLEQVEYFEEDEKHDDEEGSEAEEGKETFHKKYNWRRPLSWPRANLFTRRNKSPV